MSLPNLDDMPTEELATFYRTYAKVTKPKALALVGERKAYIAIAGNVATYAFNTLHARALRHEGQISMAAAREAHNERLYAQLPDDLKW